MDDIRDWKIGLDMSAVVYGIATINNVHQDITTWIGTGFTIYARVVTTKDNVEPTTITTV